MPTLEWIGKDKVINHHLDVPYRVLERKYSYDEAGQHDEDNGSENMIIHGDNLDALKALLPQYESRVKCIYIDPPYNTGNEGWVYNDNVNDPRIKKWLGEVVGKEGEDLSRHDKWLKLVMIEYKGDNLDNSDSKRKLKLGRLWQAQAGPSYRYFMVFKNREFGIDGAYTLDDFVAIMREL